MIDESAQGNHTNPSFIHQKNVNRLYILEENITDNQDKSLILALKMGCLKLSYYEQGRALEVNPIFFTSAVEKKRYAEKNRLSSSTYGFNGQEGDSEIKGSGNSLAFRLRIYDPRLGKFLSVDPLAPNYPWYTPYAFAGNTPIVARDVEGGEPESMVTWQIEHDNKALLKNEINKDEWFARAKARAAGGVVGLGIVGAFYGGASAWFWAFSHPIETTVIGGTVASAIDPNPAADYTPGLPGDEILGNMIGQGFRSLAKTKVGSYTANQLGKMGEYALKSLYGGGKQTFKTSFGTRFVDNFADGVAYESKVGYTSATEFVKKQFAKDIALLDDAESGVKEVVWTFYRSPQTGKVGASQPLLDMFKQAQEAGYNIRTQVLDLSEEAIEQGAKTQ